MAEFGAGWRDHDLVAAIEGVERGDEKHGPRTTPTGIGADIRRRASAFRFRELTLPPAIALAIVAGTLISDAFLTTNNFLNILQQSSELSVLVIAESLILIAGKFDLSLESTVGLPRCWPPG